MASKNSCGEPKWWEDLMRAKTVNEEQNFEKGQDPKEAMGLGVGDKLKMEAIGAFTHWLYYIEHDFVKRVWGGTWLENHLTEKWNTVLERSKEGYIDPNTIMKFVRDLDETNRELLYKYILKNHSNKW
jgi:hypothetical protein